MQYPFKDYFNKYCKQIHLYYIVIHVANLCGNTWSKDIKEVPGERGENGINRY